MCLFDKTYNQCLLENNMIKLFHGSGMSDKLEVKAGTWFVDDPNSELLNYYANRSGKNKILAANVNLGKCNDLTMYDANDKIPFKMAKSFIYDLTEDDEFAEEIASDVYTMDIDYEYDDDEEIVSISRIIYIIMKNRIEKIPFDSFKILENDNVTYCILNTNNIFPLN